MRPKNQPGMPKWHGHTLKVRRVAAGWRLADLADRIGVSKSTVRRWEADTNSPTSKHVAAIAEALDVNPTVFGKPPRFS